MPSLNCFADHAPKPHWLERFFETFDLLEQIELKAYLADHLYLGPVQVDYFARFLRESGLITAKRPYKPSKLALLGKALKCRDPDLNGLLWINLATVNPQIRWYIKTLWRDRIYEPEDILRMLDCEEVPAKGKQSIYRAFRRFAELPFGTSMHMGFAECEGRHVLRIGRTPIDLGKRGHLVLLALLEALGRVQKKNKWSLAELSVENEEPLLPLQFFLWERDELCGMLRNLYQKAPNLLKISNDCEQVEIDPNLGQDQIYELFQETL